MSFCECKNIVRRVLHCLCHFARAVKDLYDEEVERLHNRGQAPPHKKNKGVKRRTWWAQKQGWVDPPKVPTQPREPPPPHLVVSSDDEQEAEQEGEYEYFDDDAYGQDQQQFDDDAYGQDEFDIVETPGVQIEELPPETCRLTRPLSHFSRLHTSQCVWCHTHTSGFIDVRTRLVSLPLTPRSWRTSKKTHGRHCGKRQKNKRHYLYSDIAVHIVLLTLSNLSNVVLCTELRSSRFALYCV